MKVAGIDGCKKGWIAVVLESTHIVEIRVFEDFAAVVAGLGGVESIGIDIPLGVPENGGRRADLLAKQHLGSRGVTVFEVPPRRVLAAPDYEAAKRLAEPGKQPSIQLWGISKKILQVNDHPGLDPRFFEVHPEVTFFEMAGQRALPSKKSWNGFWRRVELLAEAGIFIPTKLQSGPGEAGPDDVLDAAAAAWTALKKAGGNAIPLPDSPEMMGGREVAIWYPNQVRD